MLQAVLDCVYTVAVLPQTRCLLPLCPPTICFCAFLFLEPEEFSLHVFILIECTVLVPCFGGIFQGQNELMRSSKGRVESTV